MDDITKRLLLEGIGLQKGGKLDEALALFQQALERAPQDVLVLNSVAGALHDIGKTQEALGFYNEAMKINPQESVTYEGMARLFLSGAHYEKAELCLRQVLKRDPGNAGVLHQLFGTALRQDKEEEARAIHTQLEQLAPSPLLPFEEMRIAPSVWPDNASIDRHRQACQNKLEKIPTLDIAPHLAELRTSDAGIDFRLLCHGRDNLAFRKAYAEKFTCSLPVKFKPNDSGKYRVGIHLSAFFENVFLKLFHRMLDAWEHDDIELFILCHPPGMEKCRLAIRNPRIRYVLLPDDLWQATKTVRDQALDMVYFWEVGSNATNYFLPLLRLAPLQCTSWGTVETTGLPQVDYFLSSRPQEGADTQKYYSEKLYLLDHLPACLQRPPGDYYQRRTRGDFGFAEKEIIYALPHHLWKLHPDIDQAVATILSRDKNAVVVFVQSVIPRLSGALQARLAKLPKELHERVRFLPYQGFDAYLSLLASADVILDTLHYSGGQTSLEAFAAGTPVVTLPGDYMRSRSTLAAYLAMGLENAGGVASSMENYAEKALALGSDTNTRRALAEAIRDNSGKLFENPHVADDHARFFRHAIDRLRSARPE